MVINVAYIFEAVMSLSESKSPVMITFCAVSVPVVVKLVADIGPLVQVIPPMPVIVALAAVSAPVADNVEELTTPFGT